MLNMEYGRVPVEVEALVDPTETPSQGLRRAFHVDVQRWGLEHVPNAPVLLGDAVMDADGHQHCGVAFGGTAGAYRIVPRPEAGRA